MSAEKLKTMLSMPYLAYALNETLLGRDTFKYYEQLNKVRWYSTDQIRQYQFEKLKRLLVYAYSNTAYYREVFDGAGLDPNGMKGLDDLKKIPLLSKDDIRNNAGGLIERDKKGLTRYATSGSTGHPLIFYLSKERVASGKAIYLMFYKWWDLGIGDREIVFWGSTRDFSAYNVLKKLRDNLLHTRLLPVFNMGERIMLKYIKFLRNYRPKNIFGYTHSIYLLARFAKNHSLKLDDIGLKVVMVTAEVLHDFQRQLIEEVFSCPVANFYGGRESGLVAFECPKGRMHMNPNIITEVVRRDKDTPSENKGEIVITDLDSYGMPFIRYKTGDEAIMGDDKPCACGSFFKTIKKILGRDTDYIVNAKGDFIHPLALEYIFRELEGIDYFRIVQKKEDELAIDIVANSRFDKSQENGIKDKIETVMDAPVNITFHFIGQNDIPTQDKYKFVVSEIMKKYL